MSSDNHDMLSFTNDQGEKVDWKRLSARIPEFLEKYPLGQYSLHTDVTDILALQPGLKELYLRCIETNIAPESMGLPSISEYLGVIVTRKLVKDGEVVAESSAQSPLTQYKDYERVETAALQRLLALLGFPGRMDGGGSFDDDEMNDLCQQGLAVQPDEDTQDSLDAISADSSPVSSEPEPTETVVDSHSERALPAEASAVDSQTEFDETPIDVATLRIIRHRVKTAMEDPDEVVPEFKYREEGLKWLEDFMASKNAA